MVMMRWILVAVLLSGGGCARWQKPMIATIDHVRVATEHAMRLALLACKPVVEACKLQHATEKPPAGWRCPALTACHQMQTESAAAIVALQKALAAAAEVPR